MSKWTDAELAALEQVSADTGMAAYHAFGAITNYSKSFNAFEVKRRRVTQGSPATVDAIDLGVSTPPVPRPISEWHKITGNYIGFEHAFWDLETTFSTQPIILAGCIADQFGNIETFRKGPDITDDYQICADLRDALDRYDIWFTWNGKLFDVPVLNGRLRFHGMEPLPPKMHVDLMYKATGSSMRIGRRSLQSVSEYFGVQNRKTPLSVRTWDKAMAGSEEAYDLIIEHCEADVLVTRDVFNVQKPLIGTVQR